MSRQRGHFKSKPENHQARSPDAPFPQKVDNLLSRRPQNMRQRRWLFHCQNKTNKAVRYGNILLLLLLKAPSGVGNAERVSPSAADYGSGGTWWAPPAGSGAKPGPKKLLSGGTRTAVVAILVANFVFFSQGLRLNHHQLGCRPSLSTPCLMLSCVRHSLTLRRHSRHFYLSVYTITEAKQ